MSSCHVCGHKLEGPFYRNTSQFSVNSLCQLRNGRVEVSFCRNCGHMQSGVFRDLGDYYDKSYNILTSSAEEDHLYSAVNGVKVYRTEHQARTLLEKMKIPYGACVLDFGCAKAATLRRVCAVRPDITPYVFDVSSAYMDFWHEFVAREHCAVHELPKEWSRKFDIVLSFFALEHVNDPIAFCRSIASLLKPDGFFYFIVPNVFANTADMIVDDHVNHFSESSLRHLLARTGFSPFVISDSNHTGAWVVYAAAAKEVAEISGESPEKIIGLEQQVLGMARFWESYVQHIRSFELGLSPEASIAIYGAGFYGTVIAASLARPQRIACFIDQNPHLQQNDILGRPVVSVKDLPAEVTHVLVGLNPKSARQTIASLEVWDRRDLKFFFP